MKTLMILFCLMFTPMAYAQNCTTTMVGNTAFTNCYPSLQTAPAPVYPSIDISGSIAQGQDAYRQALQQQQALEQQRQAIAQQRLMMEQQRQAIEQQKELLEQQRQLEELRKQQAEKKQ